MKRLLIPCICIVAVASLAGCSNNNSQTMTTFNNQIVRVESIVKSTSVEEVSSVSPSVTLSSNEPYNSIQYFRALSNENMLREEEIRKDILSMSSTLKTCAEQKYKLSKNRLNSLKSITNNLTRNTSNLNDTKSNIKNTVSKIKKSLKVSSINIEEATSSYIILNNCMNERYAYLCNIYDNLEQACILLDCECLSDCKNCKNNENINEENVDIENNNIEELTQTKNDLDGTEKENQGSFKKVKNIDSYANNNSITDNDQSPSNQQINNPPLPQQQNTLPHMPQYHQNPHRPYPYNLQHQNYWGNPAYGYNYGYSRINPNRNTDTFYSYNRNIDTYRYSPNFYQYNYDFTY